MIAQSMVAFDREYYAKYYSDWMRSRSKFRRFAVPLGFLIVVVGVVVFIRFTEQRFLGAAVIGFGVFHLFDALTFRSRWIKKRLNSGGSREGRFEFYDDRVHIRSDSSEGHFLLSGFIDTTPSENGIFLIPQKGLSFYIPWSSIEPREALPHVRSLIKKTERDCLKTPAKGGDSLSPEGR